MSIPIPPSASVSDISKFAKDRNLSRITITKRQKEFCEKYCKNTLSNEELKSMKNEFIALDQLVDTFENVLDGFKKYKNKIDKSIENVQKTTLKMEEHVDSFNNTFIESFTHSNCKMCNIHCLPVLTKNIKKPPGRPTSEKPSLKTRKPSNLP